MSKMPFLIKYYEKVEARRALNIEPLPLNVEEVTELIQYLKEPFVGYEDELLYLIKERVTPGVDPSAKIKADFLNEIVLGKSTSPIISKKDAIALLGKMKGGFNIPYLISYLNDETIALDASNAICENILIYDAINDIAKLYKEGNKFAKDILEKFKNAYFLESKADLKDTLTFTVFKVDGEINTDDLSPATDAFTRPDIPLHARAMFKNSRANLKADNEGVTGPLTLIQELKDKGNDLIFVGDVVGTGSSRKSAANSLLYHIGHAERGTPNKKFGGFVLGGKIAPIFYNTLKDSGAFARECDVTTLKTGDVITLHPYEGTIQKDGKVVATFAPLDKVEHLELKAGGRIPFIIAKDLARKAATILGIEITNPLLLDEKAKECKAYTRAQKIVGKACGRYGVAPNETVLVNVATVGSQDTTGPMTRDELVDLSCLKFSAPLVMQSFCHTAAYPKLVDVKMQETLPEFMISRGGVALHPGDGVIHSFLNRMCLPDTLGTGGDSHTRTPLGISFAAGSLLVAFAASTGTMPLTMPESVLIKVTGTRRPGITLRDTVHAIAYEAKKQGLLTVEKKNKKNIFSGTILEIEGLEDLEVEHAFEICDASAERSAAACSIRLNKDKIDKYLKSNIVFLKDLIARGYESKQALLSRIEAMQDFIDHGTLIEKDEGCSYKAIVEINLDELKEPILCAPNDPDDVRLLSEVSGDKIDEVFVGSCMTNIGHFRAVAKILESHKSNDNVRLWLTPPTFMDRDKLKSEGLFNIFAKAQARIEIPGCSLCMGNQARVRDGATVVSTSTRNFPNRLGTGANVYLASAELASCAAILGRLPTVSEYNELTKVLVGHENEIYKLLDFNER